MHKTKFRDLQRNQHTEPTTVVSLEFLKPQVKNFATAMILAIQGPNVVFPIYSTFK